MSPVRRAFFIYENFAEAAGEVTPELDDVPEERDAEGASFVARSSPSGGSNDLKRLYLLGLASARQTVDITTPYFGGDITDAMPVKYASRKHYEQLMALGIEIYEYQPTMMHTKTFVVDGIWSMFGSANFDNRSLELNDEMNLAVTSRDLAARLLTDFQQDLQASKRLDLETWRKRSLLMKVREQFWASFGEIF